MENLKWLKGMRENLAVGGVTSSLITLGLERALKLYTDHVLKFLDDAQDDHKQDVEVIEKVAATAKAQMDSSAVCGLSFTHVYIIRSAEKKRRAQIAEANAVLARRQEELHEALELMHRQYIMHAFVASGLSWNKKQYSIDGVPQGCFSTREIIASRLTRHAEDTHDGVYRLRLRWEPAPGATKYPTNIYIDRINERHFDIEYVKWADYTEPTGFDLRSKPMAATIRCRFVAHVQRVDRFKREVLERAEKQYKKSLPFWKALTYKEGDYQRLMAEQAATDRWNQNM